MIKRPHLTFLVFNLLWGAVFSLYAQTLDTTKKTKWEYSLGFGLNAPEGTRGITLFPQDKYALFPESLPFEYVNQPSNRRNNAFNSFKPLTKVLELGANYRINNYFNIGLRSAYIFNNEIYQSNFITKGNYKRFNQQFEVKLNLNGEFEDQFNLIFFTQGAIISNEIANTYIGPKENGVDLTGTETHMFKFFSHSLGVGFEWVEYFKNNIWGYGICLKVGNDMQYRRSIEKTEYSLNGENLLPLLNKNQTSFIFRNEVPANTNTNINEPTYAPRDFLPYAFAQLTLRFIYLR